MIFNVIAEEEKTYKTIFSGTMGYYPRIGEKLFVNYCTFLVKDIKHIMLQGKHDPEIRLILEQIMQGKIK